MPRKFPFFFQLDGMDCGHPCLKMIAEFYGKTIELQLLRDYSYFVKDGVSLLGISQVANKLNTTSNKQYTVECSNGSNGWTKVCDGKLSCASLINDCLNQGGCATICNKQMTYVPQTSTFYLIN
ncbi:MAG: hypothetical protein COZ76_00840 [Flavobacteriales bacterium CG_4_8_14_3_um_filter_35_10]|nr:MAG: hypothetical protein COZ76_00840 [Flavobacteriales bacterium CG_4_8_14_3_um_filter_35_10]PJA05038.1 MAG: hypothetical protein COX71_08750 [Flavobacteriales bacterium CG_4_10_14_0_2_um_filter_35_18]